MYICNITFGARSILKKEFERGKIPLKKDITGHELRRGESTLDHTIAKSKKGPSNLYNYSLMNPIANNKRGNKPIRGYIDLESLIEYIRVFLDVKTMEFDGIDYLRGWLKTLQRALREGK